MANRSTSKSSPLDAQIRIKATPEFRSWVDDLADHTQHTMASIVTQGLMLFAESKGFHAPPLRKPR